MREKTILSMLDHPNIIRLHTSFQNAENLYFVLEYHELGDLKSKIDSKMSIENVKLLTLQIINALEYMREHKVVHRDLKPQNILIDKNQEWIISDFGAAKVINYEEVEKDLKQLKLETDLSNETFSDFEMSFRTNTEEDNMLQKQHTFVGTPLYVSPEMLQHNIALFSSDLWALGCIIYEWLLGVPPFNGKTQYEVFAKILDCSLEIPSDLDQDAEDLILKLLDIDPFSRIGAGEIGSGNDLDAIRKHPFLNSG